VFVPGVIFFVSGIDNGTLLTGMKYSKRVDNVAVILSSSAQSIGTSGHNRIGDHWNYGRIRKH